MTSTAARNDLLSRLYPAVQRYCAKYAPPHEADDLTHIVMLTLLIKADRVDPADPDFNEMAWAFGTAKYALMGARRRGWRFLAFTDLVADDDATPFDPAETPKDDASAELPAKVNRVREVMNRLPAADRKILDDQFRDGKSDLELAARLGVTVAEVEGRAAEALGRLKKKLLAVNP